MDKQLNRIVAEVLLLDEREVSDALTPEISDRWDSIAHLRLVTAVEQAFAITLSMSEIQSISSIARLRQLLRKHVTRP